MAEMKNLDSLRFYCGTCVDKYQPLNKLRNEVESAIQKDYDNSGATYDEPIAILKIENNKTIDNYLANNITFEEATKRIKKYQGKTYKDIWKAFIPMH